MSASLKFLTRYHTEGGDFKGMKEQEQPSYLIWAFLIIKLTLQFSYWFLEMKSLGYNKKDDSETSEAEECWFK